MERKSRSKAGKSTEVADNNRNCCLNVLFVGHAGAGKTKAMRKILQIHLNNVKKPVERRLIRHLAHTDTSEAQSAKDNQIKFGTQIDTETTRFNILDMPSSFDFVSKLMYKASQADIAVLFISGCGKELNNPETFRQTQQCICLVTALSIPKIVVVVNKMDDLDYMNDSVDGLCKMIESYVQNLKSDTTKVVKCLPMSGEKGLNIHSKLKEDECTWWKGPCLFDVLEAILVPVRSFSLCKSNELELRFVKDLIQIDFKLETAQEDSTCSLWFERAKLLGVLNRFAEAFQAASKASANPCDDSLYKDLHPFSLLIQGHQHRAKKEFKKALECYYSAKVSLRRYNNDFITETVRDIIVNTCTERDEKKKKAEEEKKSSVASASQNKEDEAEISEVREVSRQKPSKKEKNKENEDSHENMQTTNFESSGLKIEEIHDDDNIDEEKDIVQNCEPQGINADLSISGNYELTSVIDGVYTGNKIIGCINKKTSKSFIQCLESQLQNYEKLEYLGLKGVNVLKIDDAQEIRSNEGCSIYFVVQPVYTLDVYFMLELQKFFKINPLQNADSVLHDWWQFIKDKFKKVFREIMNALISLDSMGFACGNLSFSTYVTVEGDAHVLPTMQCSLKSGDDIIELVKCMKRILYFVCPKSNHSSFVDPDLDHLLGFLTNQKLKYVPLRWIFNHHVFWSPNERVQFIHNLKNMRSRNDLMGFGKFLGHEMVKEDPFYFWQNQIPNGIFLEIWKKGDPSRPIFKDGNRSQLEQSGWVQVHPYIYPSDVIRYMTGVFSHYNQSDYSNFRVETLDEEGIERELLKMFPKIYMQVVDALYEYIVDCINMGMQPEDVKRMLKKLTLHLE